MPNFTPHTSVSASLVEAMLSLNTTVNVSYGGDSLSCTHIALHYVWKCTVNHAMTMSVITRVDNRSTLGDNNALCV